ncbi:hypothetical protein N7478_000560 [Penicillium angulare]|uniref:uncharacterized protein n=1 Tax=Penicillium angulare TaxID=116970 RepID=UPI002540F9AA|nr:uncharacterized protein N7478_000560 [Penicillium angulare]KAJ5291309.1 hypothetical protein N7478_000560 [Penicillium angulare]
MPSAPMNIGTQQTSTAAAATLGGGNNRQISIGDNPPPLELSLQTEQPGRAHIHTSEDQPLDLLSPERVKRALQSFFDSIYPLPTFSFLHKASLLRWNQTGQADHCLLLSIIAITSRLPGRDATEVNLGIRCSALAQNLILRDQGRPNIIKAQSLLLTIRYHMWSGNTSEALILMATLARFAFALRLNYENPNLCSLAQESRRRLMWAVYVLDTFLAGGIPEFTLCPSNVLHTSLPNQETTFELDTSYVSVPLHGPGDCSEDGDIGLLGYYIRVIYLRDSVLSSLNRSQLNDESISEDMPFLESRPTEAHTSIPVAADEDFVSPETPRGRSAQQLDASNTGFTSRGLGVIPSLTMPEGIPDPRGQDLWDQTSAFEGAWDVAIFHPMYDQQDIWPVLNLFPTHMDMDKS